MTLSDERIQSLMAQVEQRERRARQRAFLYAALPVLLAIALVGFTALQIQRLAGVQAELKSAEGQLQSVKQQLSTSADLVQQSQAAAAQSQAALQDVQTELADTQSEAQQASSQLEATRQELDQANVALKDAEQRTTELQAQVDSLRLELQNVSDQLAEASTLRRFVVDISEEDAKDISAFLPEAQASLFLDVMNQRFYGLRYNPTGNSPETGFNSPNYAAYVLRQHKALPDSYDFAKKPWEQLPKAERPQNGDLVYYKSGYTMFYFNQQVEFVIGMTPVGILALRPDFATVLGYLEVKYP